MRSKKYWSAKRPPTISEDLSKFGLQSPTFSNDEIATRKKYSLEAMHALESALVALGDVEDAQRLKTEIALFESEKRLPKKKATDKRKIDEVLFWHIIEDCKAASNSSPEYLQNLRSRLEQFSASEIKSFQKRLMQKVEELKSWDLWALAYIVRRGCSNDAFDYFCAWVVAQGRTAFELAKGDIPQFANEVSIEEDLQLEELMYVAEEVYESNTGSPMKSINVAAARIRGKQWEEADLPQRYPDLSALFGFTPPTDA